ncbi:hypothetical protein Angca_001227, partial [Angiostrongylus cantonensis]
RYLYLLRPVKNRRKNFRTNIAKEFDDYCSSLGKITVNEKFYIDNQHRHAVIAVFCRTVVLNFAEAAMHILGSAFAFAGNADYVHSQAMHFFETLHPHETNKKKKAASDEGFVDENEGAIDPCDLIAYSSLKPCNPESLCK